MLDSQLTSLETLDLTFPFIGLDEQRIEFRAAVLTSNDGGKANARIVSLRNEHAARLDLFDRQNDRIGVIKQRLAIFWIIQRRSPLEALEGAWFSRGCRTDLHVSILDGPGAGIFSMATGVLPAMTQPPSDSTTVVAIRAASARDADSIARVFLDSAAYHASLDPERYRVPDVASIAERYREGLQHPRAPGGPAVTLVAKIAGELLGFVDARIERSQDLMHRDMTYCHVPEIAVGNRHQSQGVGGQLLRAAEAWGRQHSAAFASLEHHIANSRAGAFYVGRMGYSVAATILIKSLQTPA